MFRLDYIQSDGRTIAPVLGSEVGILPTGDVLTRHMTTARGHARRAAELSGKDVLITRIVGAGTMKPSAVVHPDGSGSRPPGTRAANPREDCKRASGERCWCSACRAERRAAQHA